MQSSKLGLQKWAIALYLTATGIKGTASMKVYRDIGMRQATAWHLMHRIREAFDDGVDLPFPGPVEADEAYFGGKRENMPKAKRKTLKGRGPVGKTVVVGTKDRATNKVSATVVETPNKRTLHRFIADRLRRARKSTPTIMSSTAAFHSIMRPSGMWTANTSGATRTPTGLRVSGAC